MSIAIVIFLGVLAKYPVVRADNSLVGVHVGEETVDSVVPIFLLALLHLNLIGEDEEFISEVKRVDERVVQKLQATPYNFIAKMIHMSKVLDSR